MQKNKKILCIFIVFITFISCNEYTKVLNRGNAEEQYKLASKLYEQQKYSKALRLFQKVIPAFRGKPQMERIQYMVANCNYNQKDYGTAGYYFNRFAKNYPKSSKVEDARFFSALGYYHTAPRFSLDPTETNKALESFQNFIDAYPNSSRIEEANKYYNELRNRLERKSFEIAKTYYRTADYDYRNYKASIAAFDNLLSDFLGTKYKEEALYYRLKASHDYAMKSTKRRKPERIKEAIKSYDKLKRSFPESKYMEDSNKMLTRLEQEQLKISESVKS